LAGYREALMSNEQPESGSTESKSKRISITKAQSHSDIAVELIALCQTVTEDGSLSDAEVQSLQKWLAEYHTSDLPAIEFLTKAVETIVADGKITDEERKALHEALEAVLPTELRRSAKNKRLELQRLERAKAKLDKQLAREQELAAAEQNAPVESFDFMVAGAHIGGRRVYIEAYARSGDPVEIAREPSNRYSRHAVQVRLKTGQQIGYVPEEDARELAPLLDAGMLYTAEIKKILTGGRSPRPVIVLDVFDANARVPGLRRATIREGERISLFSKILLIAIAVIVVYFIFR
jgi:hypothetical protein